MLPWWLMSLQSFVRVHNDVWFCFQDCQQIQICRYVLDCSSRTFVCPTRLDIILLGVFWLAILNLTNRWTFSQRTLRRTTKAVQKWKSTLVRLQGHCLSCVSFQPTKTVSYYLATRHTENNGNNDCIIAVNNMHAIKSHCQESVLNTVASFTMNVV